MIVRLKSDLVNTKETALLVCDKSYHTKKRKVQKGEEIEALRNCALFIVFEQITFKHSKVVLTDSIRCKSIHLSKSL